MVVDDDAFVRDLLCLDLPDVELVEMTRVSEALAAFSRRERIDAIVVDLRLSDGNGLEVVRSARSHSWTRNLPIVVLTAGFDSDDAAEVYTAGADGYLAKPFVAAEVLAIIEHVGTLDLTERRRRRRLLARGVEVVEFAPRAPDADAELGVTRRFWRRSAAVR
jgi:DNA-binding response OmpR family regulator